MSIEKTVNQDVSRRAMLMKLGLVATTAYTAPVLLQLGHAHASGGSGGGSGGGGRGGRGGHSGGRRGGRGSGGSFSGRGGSGRGRRGRGGSFSSFGRRVKNTFRGIFGS